MSLRTRADPRETRTENARLGLYDLRPAAERACFESASCDAACRGSACSAFKEALDRCEDGLRVVPRWPAYRVLQFHVTLCIRAATAPYPQRRSLKNPCISA